MDWRTVRFDWNRARAFLVTAEEGSLSAAARALGMTQPTVGRQVDALEQELDVALFARVGKRLELTEAGLDLLEYVRPMGDAANRFSLAASGRSHTLEGAVCITVGDMFAAHVLPPILAEVRVRWPKIDIDIVATNVPQDLRRREADIAIRAFRPKEPELFARKVNEKSGTLYAATAYLDRIGRPQSLAELSRADFIGFDRNPTLIEFLNARGLSLSQDNFPFACENQLVQWELVKHGLGIGVQADNIAEAEPLVEPAAPEFDVVPFPIWLVSHREIHTSKRVRVVFDLLAEELGKL